MDDSKFQRRSKSERKNHYYPKKITQSKYKRFTPYNDVIEYLKSGRNPKFNQTFKEHDNDHLNNNKRHR